MSQTKQAKPTRPTTDTGTVARPSVDRDAELAATDALLDEIDSVLEDACEATRFLQKGGQ